MMATPKIVPTRGARWRPGDRVRVGIWTHRVTGGNRWQVRVVRHWRATAVDLLRALRGLVVRA